MLLAAGLVWGLWFAIRSAKREFVEADPPRAARVAAPKVNDRAPPGLGSSDNAKLQP